MPGLSRDLIRSLRYLQEIFRKLPEKNQAAAIPQFNYPRTKLFIVTTPQIWPKKKSIEFGLERI